MKQYNIPVLLSFVLCILLLASWAGAEIIEDEEEILLDDVFENWGADMETQFSSQEETVIIPDETLEPDGSTLITISATGDFTIGGDSRKRTDIFQDELDRQNGDINFTMKNMRDVFLADDLTIVNFESTNDITSFFSVPFISIVLLIV